MLLPLGAGTGAPPLVAAGPAVDRSGGARGSTFDPVPCDAPLGEGDIPLFSVFIPDALEPDKGSTFDPVPGDAGSEGYVDVPLVPRGEVLVSSFDGEGVEPVPAWEG